MGVQERSYGKLRLRLFVWVQAHCEYIQTLEQSLQQEMTRHSPLYGIGLAALSAMELEALHRIHQDGIQKVHRHALYT